MKGRWGRRRQRMVVVVLLRGGGNSCTKPPCCSTTPRLRTTAAMRDSETSRASTSMSHLRRSSCKAARYQVRASVYSRGTCPHVEMQPLGFASSLDVEHDVQLGFGRCSGRSPRSHKSRSKHTASGTRGMRVCILHRGGTRRATGLRKMLWEEPSLTSHTSKQTESSTRKVSVCMSTDTR